MHIPCGRGFGLACLTRRHGGSGLLLTKIQRFFGRFDEISKGSGFRYDAMFIILCVYLARRGPRAGRVADR